MKKLWRIVLLASVIFSSYKCARPSELVPEEVTREREATTLPRTPTRLPGTDTPEPTPTETLVPTVPPSGISYVNPMVYRVNYEVTVFNNGYDLSELRIYQPKIVEWNEQRDVVIEEISPSPTSSGVDPSYSNEMYYWRMLGQPSRGGSTTFMLRFKITAYETSTVINPAEILSYDKDNLEFQLYTRSERYIEVDDQEISRIAEQLSEGESNPYLIARTFYDYVIDNYRYRLLGEGLRGAKKLVSTGIGECGDYAALFVALARAEGIPARPVVGYWAHSGIEQTHVWAEFFLEPFGWVPVDPTLGQSDRSKREYYFGNMDNERVILNKGYNLNLDPSAPGNFVAPFLQVPLWWFWGSGGDPNNIHLERSSWVVTKIQ
jgi:transglutaminase-like putative cysteine protease